MSARAKEPEGARPDILKPTKGMKCEAAYDFNGASKEDLPFKKGDILTIENPTEDPNWWLVRDKTGRTGMIPANYVELIGSDTKKTGTLPRDASGQLIPMPWFHGKISRELAESLLMPREDGLFLVRESAHFPGDYTLCVCFQDQVDHYRMQGKNGKLTIDEEVYFSSLEELVQHYEKDADGLCTRLRKPVVKQGGREFKIDARKFVNWEISPREIVKSAQIGSGQFGDVFEGLYRGQKVAIKTLKDVQGDAIDQFLLEADTMTRLRHKNLVQLIGVCTQGSPIMIVSEFMGKGCLLDYLRSRGRAVINLATQLGFCRDICAAMEYLEEQKFVHRDLAARNILLSDDGVAKVADFGLAKDSQLGVTDIGKLPIKWTAPEAIRLKVSTSKSDVWSFGVVLWEIFAFGRAPYPRMGQKEVVDAVVKGYRMECPDTCPKEVYDKIMMACWEIDPVKRPTFKTLMRALSSIQA
uniref:non-specific protein-tyrosine kinase n=1 Tax=Monosiga ovata TaxID=81526 RepID=Q0PDJ5_9EUKA|nr:protein tyrosine kinase CSK [Monosiga ovata]